MDLEQSRKDARRLVSAFNAADPEAIARAHDVLGARADERFLLSDAQHVVAVERGYRSWPDMARTLRAAPRERPVSRIGLQPLSDYERRARELAASAASADPDAVRTIRAYVPRLREFAGGALESRDARLAVAREYGFETWRQLARTVERVRAEHEGQREGSPQVLAALGAIETGDAQLLGRLLDQHPELTGACHNGAWNTLLEALAQPDVLGERLGVALGVDRSVAELLIARSEDLDTPLNLAACFNRAELVGMLIAAGADPCPSPSRGLTPLEAALYHGARESAELIAEHGISPRALWSVSALGRIELMRSFIDEQGGLLPQAGAHRPNLADVGWPPAPPAGDDPQEILDEALCHAAHNGRDQALRWLLDHGADVNCGPYLGLTPLHFAVQFGHLSTVALLLEHGADPAIRDRIHDASPRGWADRAGRAEIATRLARSSRESARHP